MFDNLRNLSDPLPEDEEQDDLFKDIDDDVAVDEPVAAPARKKRRKNQNFLGLTAQQRFLISVMLFFTVCLLGTLVMFVLGRMSLF